MPRYIPSLVLSCALVFALQFKAHADIGEIGGAIGKIGTPVVPSNLPNSPENAATSPAETNTQIAVNKIRAIFTISFSARRNNYQAKLREAILDEERNFPITIYEVGSVVPNDGKPGNTYGSYTENLNAVVKAIVALGVPTQRVHPVTKRDDNASSQEVTIYGLEAISP